MARKKTQTDLKHEIQDAMIKLITDVAPHVSEPKKHLLWLEQVNRVERAFGYEPNTFVMPPKKADEPKLPLPTPSAKPNAK